ncbi:hypothetical protein IP84_04230 [beta proteobacterium AAP99]|nr:hypothetical protein IP84_04230 [beta proteobacterium AAP99]
MRSRLHELYVMEASRVMKAHRADSDLSFAELARRMREDYGIEIDAQSLRNKLNRGTLSLAYAMMLLDAMGVRTLKIPDLKNTPQARGERW